MSLLKQKIDEYHASVLAHEAQAIVDYYLRQFKSIGGELGETITTFSACLCAEDFKGKKGSDDLWEAACKLMDADKEFVKQYVGISLDLQNATTVSITYAGV